MLDLGNNNSTIKNSGMISIGRGDTLTADVSMYHNDSLYMPDRNDILRFVLKKSYDDLEPIIVKDIPVNNAEFVLDTVDTEVLDEQGEYFYELTLLSESSDIG